MPNDVNSQIPQRMTDDEFEQICEDYYERVVRLFRFAFEAPPESTREDLAQEVFLKLHRKRNQLEPHHDRGKLWGLLKTIVKSVLFDELRRQIPKRGTFANGENLDRTAVGNTSQMSVHGKAITIALVLAIEELSEVEQQVIQHSLKLFRANEMRGR